MQPKTILKTLAIICLMTAILVQCKRPAVRTTGKVDQPRNENYDWYPTKDNNTWTYQLTIVEIVAGTSNNYTEISRYSADSGRMNNYRNGMLWSWAGWVNDNNKLGCCGD